jgi:hypothetical protein
MGERAGRRAGMNRFAKGLTQRDWRSCASDSIEFEPIDLYSEIRCGDVVVVEFEYAQWSREAVAFAAFVVLRKP